MPILQAGNWKSRRGFTLIELVVVLFIVALVAGLVIPRLGLFISHGDTQKAVRQMRGLVRYLSGLAITTKTEYRLYYDLKKGVCWAAHRDEQGEFIPEQESLIRPLHLPPGVRFQDIITPRGEHREGVAYTDFFPSGGVEWTLIHLEGDSRITLRLLPLTGELKVYEGYVSEVER